MKGRERRLDCPPALLMSFFFCPCAMFLRTLLCCHFRSTSVLHFCLVFFLSLFASPILAAHFPLGLSLNLQPAHLVGWSVTPFRKLLPGHLRCHYADSAQEFPKPLLFPTHKQRGGHWRRGGGPCMLFFSLSLWLGTKGREKSYAASHCTGPRSSRTLFQCTAALCAY